MFNIWRWIEQTSDLGLSSDVRLTSGIGLTSCVGLSSCIWLTSGVGPTSAVAISYFLPSPSPSPPTSPPGLHPSPPDLQCQCQCQSTCCCISRVISSFLISADKITLIYLAMQKTCQSANEVRQRADKLIKDGHFDPDAIWACAESMTKRWQQLMTRSEERRAVVTSSYTFYKSAEQVSWFIVVL